jgi:hypothetical protein
MLVVLGFSSLKSKFHVKINIYFFIPDVTVLYHSNLSFSERLYGPLDVDLCRVKLHEPLVQIVQQPLLYVRDMVPKPCFDALVKLHEVRHWIWYKKKFLKLTEFSPFSKLLTSFINDPGTFLYLKDIRTIQGRDGPVVESSAT